MPIKKLTIVNRHYPPNMDITGENAWDLARYLITEHKIDVAIVHIDRTYQGGGAKRKPVGNLFPVKTIYAGKNKLLGYISGALDGFNLIRKAVKLNHGPLIIMTSPPLLPMWASLILRRKKRDWILWSMDLFPEGYAANNIISEKNLLYQFVLRQTYKYGPGKIIALGPEQKKVLDKKYGKEIESTILPCGVFIEQQKTETVPYWKTENDKIYIGYCGNCGPAHNHNFLMAVIDEFDPEKQHLVLAIYGVKSQMVLDYAKGKPGISILPNVPRSELHYIDVHLVTLVNSWTHIAVPSKAVSSICAEATIVFCGSKESDNWALLQEAGWLVEDNNHLRENVRNVLTALNRENIQQKKANARVIAARLSKLIQDSYATIASWAK